MISPIFGILSLRAFQNIPNMIGLSLEVFELTEVKITKIAKSVNIGPGQLFCQPTSDAVRKQKILF